MGVEIETITPGDGKRKSIVFLPCVCIHVWVAILPGVAQVVTCHRILTTLLLQLNLAHSGFTVPSVLPLLLLSLKH